MFASIVFCLLVEIKQGNGSENENLKVINDLNQVVLKKSITFMSLSLSATAA